MKKLLNLLRSERAVVAGAFGSLSDQFGWNRAVARIIGFLLIWAGPYLLGAPIRKAWWISILLYVGLALIARKISCVSRKPNLGANRRWNERRYRRFANRNSCREEGGPPIAAAQSWEREPVVSSAPFSASKRADDPGMDTEEFGNALSDLERRLGRLDQRIQKMESAVTDRSFDWDRRLRQP
jgi:phage shock protein PspC (stress-responsive transcriptional regulator)